MRPRPGPQQLQASNLSCDVLPHLANLRSSLPWFTSCERPPRHALHLWPAELPPRAMSSEHRPLLPIRNGRVRGRWIAR